MVCLVSFGVKQCVGAMLTLRICCVLDDREPSSADEDL